LHGSFYDSVNFVLLGQSVVNTSLTISQPKFFRGGSAHGNTVRAKCLTCVLVVPLPPIRFRIAAATLHAENVAVFGIDIFHDFFRTSPSKLLALSGKNYPRQVM
jgi:hypothetical protein